MFRLEPVSGLFAWPLWLFWAAGCVLRAVVWVIWGVLVPAAGWRRLGLWRCCGGQAGEGLASSAPCFGGQAGRGAAGVAGLAGVPGGQDALVLRVVQDEHCGVIRVEGVLVLKSPGRRSRTGLGVQGVAGMVSLSR